MASITSAVYTHVIEDVMSKVANEFINSGAGENVLNQLQALWEMKMMQCGAIHGSMQWPSHPKPTGLVAHDLNAPYELMDEYETPTAEILFPPTPIQTPLPGTVDQTMYDRPTAPSGFTPANSIKSSIDVKYGMASHYMQPPSPWMNQRPLGVDVNVAYVEGPDEVDRVPNQPMPQDFFMMPSGKRSREDYASHLDRGGYVPQQDGSGDDIIEFSLSKESQVQPSTRCKRATKNAEMLHDKYGNTVIFLPQQDGIQDDYVHLYPFQGVANEDYISPADPVELRVGTPSVGAPNPLKGEAVDDDEPPLNENDDEDPDELEQGVELSNENLVLSQFEKVTRSKNKWKCNLRYGIMQLNNKDFLFDKASGEFEF